MAGSLPDGKITGKRCCGVCLAQKNRGRPTPWQSRAAMIESLAGKRQGNTPLQPRDVQLPKPTKEAILASKPLGNW
jgi:hypothetical protein